MKESEERECMFKKKLIRYGLCTGLVLSMTAAQPLNVMAASDSQIVEETQEADAILNGAEESLQQIPETETVQIPADAEKSEAESEGAEEEKQVEESLQKFSDVQPETEALTDSPVSETESQADNSMNVVQAQTETNEAQINVLSVPADDEVNSKDEHGCFTVPTAIMPVDENGNCTLPDGTYELPFRMLMHPKNSSAPDKDETTEPYGNPKYMQASMGNQTFSTWTSGTEMNYATLTVRDGEARITLNWPAGVGCSMFNWYEDKSGYENGDAKGGFPGDSEQGEPNQDGAAYTYEADYYTYGQLVDAITSITFTVPSENPLIYVSIQAAGMANSTQDGAIALYWNKLETVEIDEALPEEIQITGLSEMTEGDSAVFTAAVLPEQAEQAVVWNSSDESVATVDNEGTVAALKAGSVTITAKSSADSNVKSSFNVTVKEKDSETPDNPDGPEVTDALVLQFNELEEYVFALNPQEYFLNSSAYTDVAQNLYADKFNELYIELRNWITESEKVIAAAGNTIPEEQREEFEAELLEWDKKLADPEYFGRIYSSTVLAKGHRYSVPIKIYDAGETTATTPLGQETTVKTIGAENEYLKNILNGQNATVTVETDSNGFSQYVIQYPAKSKAENGDRIAITDPDKKSTNIKSASSLSSGSKITTWALYEGYYLNFKLTDGETKEKTDYPIVIVLDWANAEDTTPDAAVDLSTLQMLISSVSQRAQGNYPNSYASAYPKEASEAIIESGLLERAQEAVKKEDITQEEADRLENEIISAFSSYRTITEEIKLFSNRIAELNASAYTADSYDNLVKYAELAEEAIENYIYIVYRTPGGNAESQYPDGPDAWTQEERELAAYTNPATGTAWSTDPADGDTVMQEMFSMYLMSGQYAPAANEVYERFFELEDALVSLTDLKAAIADGEKYEMQEGEYTATSFANFTEALGSAREVLAGADATQEEVNTAVSTLNASVESLVSLTGLKTAITEAEKYEALEDDYTTTSFASFTEALESAREVLADADATKEQINTAVEELNDAVSGLTKRADKTELKAALDEANEIVKQTDKYTEASLSIYQAAIDTAQSAYDRVNISQAQVDQAAETLLAAKGDLVEISSEELDINNLADGTYSVVVNLWHASQDQESMGNAALYHTAVLTVDDGVYTLRISGHTMTVSGQTGALDALRIVPDGSEPLGDGSNYVEQEILQDGDDYYIDVVLDTSDGLSEYYYSGIKVHTVTEDGTIGYPMGQTWVANRVRISWDTITVLDVESYPAFSATDSATGVTVSAPAGALPEGTILEVTKITDADRIAEIETAFGTLVTENTAYEISLYIVENGERQSVEPANNMELTITLPVPEGYDTSKLACYYLDENNYVNELSGTLDGSFYTVVNGKIGTYAMAEKTGRDSNYTVNTNRPGMTTTTGTRPTATTTTGRTSTVKTGDETQRMLYVFLLLAAACAGSGCVLVIRRRRPQDER